MYPNFYYLVKDILGLDLPALKPIQTFGVLVTLAFLAAAFFLTKELKRKESAGLFDYEFNNGNKTIPSDTIPLVTLIAAFTGFVGARIWSSFEHWDALVDNPLNIFNNSYGYAFLGGLITAATTIWIYYLLKKINPFKVADAVAPSLMPAYALGRLGCHLVGDGDWGIINGKPKPLSWIPDWLWGYTYPHNIIKEGNLITSCTWDTYCYELSNPVYPTSFYESIIILILFYILWKLRLRINTVGRITSIYLMMISIERFFIEFIKINKHYEIIGLSLSQAQLTSIGIFIVGLTLYLYAPSLKANNEKCELPL